MMIGTDSGGYLGSGEVPRRYLIRRFSGPPELVDLPVGSWAEKSPGTELWDIVEALHK